MALDPTSMTGSTSHLLSPEELLESMLSPEKIAWARSEGNSGASKSSGPGTAEEVTPASVPPAIGLSPESLMAYCQCRLNSIDTQMNQIFTQQQSNATVTQDVNNIASALNDLPPASGSSGNGNVTMTGAEVNQIISSYQQAIADAVNGGNGSLASELTQDLNSFAGDAKLPDWNPATVPTPPATASQVAPNDLGYGGTATISNDSVTGLQQNLKNYANDLNSDSEMQMITLQSLMSQRETAVQLTTNLVQSLGDQSQDIAKNIGQ